MGFWGWGGLEVLGFRVFGVLGFGVLGFRVSLLCCGAVVRCVGASKRTGSSSDHINTFELPDVHNSKLKSDLKSRHVP